MKRTVEENVLGRESSCINKCLNKLRQKTIFIHKTDGIKPVDKI